MAVDLDDRPSTPDADKNDPAQRHFNDVFNQLTSAEHLGKDGKSGDKGSGKSLFNPSADKASSAAGLLSAEGGAKGITSGAAAAIANNLPGGLGKIAGLAKSNKGITGGMIGLILSGMVFFGLGVSSGPLQFIHVAQLLQDFHLTEQSDESDDRVGKLTRLYRYAKTGKIEQTRLGFFANNYAEKVEAKLNASGIESKYDGAGRFQGYVIDPNNENWKDLGGDNDKIKEKLKTDYGINTNATELSDGKVLINTEKTGYFSQRKLIGGMLSDAGYKGVSGAVSARIMGKRIGLTWHPIRILDTKVKSKAIDIINNTKDKFTSDVNNGTTNDGITTASAENTDEKDPATAADDKAKADAASDATKDVEKDIQGASDGDAAAKSNLKLKIGGGAVAVAGIACVIKSLDDQAATLKQAQVIEPIMRTGMEFVALGNQAMYGGQTNPNFLQQMGAMSTYLNNKNGTWTNSQTMEGEQGKKLTGVAPDKTLTTLTKGSSLDFINQGTLGTAVGAACSGVGQLVQGVFTFVTGPVSFVFGLALNEAIAASGVLTDIAGWLAGEPVNINKLVPPQLANYLNFGTKMAGDQRFLAAGGRQLSSTESGQVAALQDQQETDAFKGRSFAYRVFSPDTSRSIVGTLIDNEPLTISGDATRFSSLLSTFGSSLLSLPSRLFSGTAHATSHYSYAGLPDYGFSTAELADPDVQDPYANADYVVSNLLTSQDVISAADTCFGVSLSADGSSVQAANDSSVDIYNSGETNGYNASGCADGSAAGISAHDWLRLRMFIFDSETADSMSCYSGDSTSCTNVGFSDAATQSSTPGGINTSVSGDAKTLAAQVLSNSKIILSQSARADLTDTSQGKQSMPGQIAGGGAGTTPCTSRVPASLDPGLLQLLLNLAAQNSFEVNSLISGHNCDSGRHPLGRAADIEGLNGNPWSWGGPNEAAQEAFTNSAITILSQMYPNGHYVNRRAIQMGGVGVTGTEKFTRPPNINLFSDPFGGVHVDTGFAQ